MSEENLPKMEYRFLGRSGLQVSVISLGGWVTYGGHVGDGRQLIDKRCAHIVADQSDRGRPFVHESSL